MSKQIKINSPDLRLLIISCFRYSFGRMTYMPEFTLKMIKKYKNIFNKEDWKRFIEEIDECDNLGTTWIKLKELDKKEMGK
jgi:hypothetical protein